MTIRPPIDKARTPEMQRFFDELSRETSELLTRIEDLENLDFASEAEAEAGTATDKVMSPARTKDAILALSPLLKYAQYQEQQSSGTDAGSFASGAWRTRTLNTEVYDAIGGTLNTNEVTLPVGTYFVDGGAGALMCQAHQCRLWDATNSAALLYGTVEHSAVGGAASASSTGWSRIRGRFTLADATAVRIEHRCAATRNTDGFGRATGFGGTEIFADIIFYKLD